MERPSDDQLVLTREFKSRLKHDARKLRELKLAIKTKQKNHKYAGSEQSSLLSKKRKYRHYHIAYCMLRGKKYEQVEKACRKDNKPNFALIKDCISEYTHIAPGENVSVAA